MIYRFRIIVIVIFALLSMILTSCDARVNRMGGVFRVTPHSELEEYLERRTDLADAHLIVKYNLLDIDNIIDSNFNYNHMSFLYYVDHSEELSSFERERYVGAIKDEIDDRLRNEERATKLIAKNLLERNQYFLQVIKKSKLPIKGVIAGSKELKELNQAINHFKNPKIEEYDNYEDLLPLLAQLDRIDQIIDAIPLAEPLDHYRITSKYGIRKDPKSKRRAMHAGLDMVNDDNGRVYATASGIVSEAEEQNGYGNTILINHGNGITTRYAHLAQIMVKSGDYVSPLQVIGIQGNTGKSTGEHLHYEIRIYNRTTNPINFMAIGMKQ